MSDAADDGPDGMLAYNLAIRSPDRNDPNWPLPSFDAQDWAEAFVKAVRGQADNPGNFPPELAAWRFVTDIDTMRSWFSNALMRGYDEHAKRMGMAAE